MIIKSAPKIELTKQVQLIYPIFCLWNFNRKNNKFDEVLFEDVEEAESWPENSSSKVYVALQEDVIMKLRCNRLAKKIWTQYLIYTGQRAV